MTNKITRSGLLGKKGLILLIDPRCKIYAPYVLLAFLLAEPQGTGLPGKLQGRDRGYSSLCSSYEAIKIQPWALYLRLRISHGFDTYNITAR